MLMFYLLGLCNAVACVLALHIFPSESEPKQNETNDDKNIRKDLYLLKSFVER